MKFVEQKMGWRREGDLDVQDGRKGQACVCTGTAAREPAALANRRPDPGSFPLASILDPLARP